MSMEKNIRPQIWYATLFGHNIIVCVYNIAVCSRFLYYIFIIYKCNRFSRCCYPSLSPVKSKYFIWVKIVCLLEQRRFIGLNDQIGQSKSFVFRIWNSCFVGRLTFTVRIQNIYNNGNNN